MKITNILISKKLTSIMYFSSLLIIWGKFSGLGPMLFIRIKTLTYLIALSYFEALALLWIALKDYCLA